jgi:carbonic anhydrase
MIPAPVERPSEPALDTGPAGALRRLLDGNARYVSGTVEHCEQLEAQRTACSEEQKPFAVVLGCSDSRVPPQLIFDQGPGALFTIRVAGHVAGAEVIGSIEYAVGLLQVPLVLVLGHSRCGAVAACAYGGATAPEGQLGAVLRAIEPAVQRAQALPGDLVENAIHLHVQDVVEQLRAAEPVLAARVRDGSLHVVGAHYDVESGRVELSAEREAPETVPITSAGPQRDQCGIETAGDRATAAVLDLA